tara:strand:+ start:19 stop:714 length:696 start_codon:yes stop_codon:yes gene_type:complete
MNSDNNFTVDTQYGTLTLVPGGLTTAQFDANVINNVKDLEALQVTIGVSAYNATTTYTNDYSDTTTESFVTYNNRFWQWVNATPNSGVTPVAGADWQEVPPTILAHEKNKDSHLGTLIVKFRIYQEGTNPPEIIYYQNPKNFTLTTTYDAIGIYRVVGIVNENLTDTTKKYEISVSEGFLLSGSSIAVSASSNESLNINARDNTGSNADNIMYEEGMGSNANWTVITITKY